ncbi:DUF3048 domain-containing protein [Candidatus Uhrbacteria bacterium]|nr:DUF3048 domain-containing protein [Candidatus Uhrbacteria bacterium]
MQHKTRLRLIITAAVLVFSGTAVLLFWTIMRQYDVPVPVAIADTRRPRDLDGVLVEQGKEHTRNVAVVIDGMVDARPTVGLSKASLVWEAPAEGGIPRFLAIYPFDAVPEQVGPVRSLRPYFLDFASEVGAVLLHVGGSPEALERAKTFPLDRLNQFFDSVYFWRSSDRSAPHNVFTSGYLIVRAFVDRQYEKNRDVSLWRYAPQGRAEGTGEGLHVVFSTPPYTVEWQWNGVAHQYERFVGGDPARDADTTAITAANVVVEFTAVEILDEIGRRRIVSEGEGRALVATRGRVLEARWKKESGERTRFFDAVSGEEVSLTLGTTWIEVVPLKADVTVLPPRGILPAEQIK